VAYELKDNVMRVVTAFHRAVFSATNGKVLGRVSGMPVLMLTTTGRKTGKLRTTMLTAPVQQGDRIVLVASNGGDSRHPTWFLNLRDKPDVEVVMDGKRRPMRAHVASAEEKDELWPLVIADHQNYAGYQRRTGRDIPVVVLDPVGS
jgi:deazaflavin-dependent oxidoreductase (nitroreductase family)